MVLDVSLLGVQNTRSMALLRKHLKAHRAPAHSQRGVLFMRPHRKHAWWPGVLVCWVVGTSAWALPVRSACAQARPPTDTTEASKKLITQAQKYLGMPYVWGARGQGGFDCSGFVGYVYQQLGYELPRVSRQQALVGLAVSPGALKPGDLLFFSERPHETRITHVALSLGGTRFIHAALGRGMVAYDDLTQHYYATRLTGARRILVLPPGSYTTAMGMAPKDMVSPDPARIQTLARDMHAVAKTQGELEPATQATPDMLVEHPEHHLPAQLTVLGGKARALSGSYDGFELTSWWPDETGAGVRVGVLRAPTRTPGFAVIAANLLVTPWGLRAALRWPMAWPMWGGFEPGGFLHVPYRTTRQWGRLLYGASLGTPGAKLYAALDRTAVQTLGGGLLMRHYLPGANSSTVDDVLMLPNPLSATAEFNTGPWSTRAVVDDVLAPRIFGAHLRARPAHRLTLSLAWAADVTAPHVRLVGHGAVGRSAAYGVELGTEVLAFEGAQTQLRPYLTLAGLATNVDRKYFRGGAAAGLMLNVYRDKEGVDAHTVVFRTEARISQPGFAPSYFSTGYSAARLAAFGQADANPARGGPSKLTTLLNQSHGPARATALVELQYAMRRRLQLGVRYEDGGPLGDVPRGIANPSDRVLTVYAGLHQLPLGPTGMLLNLHGLWHAEQARDPWPGHRAAQDHTLTQLTGKLDITSYLETTLTVLHPLGRRPQGERGLVGAMSVNVHKAF
jgi:cell wall-associated NlpC family hydrolase